MTRRMRRSRPAETNLTRRRSRSANTTGLVLAGALLFLGTLWLSAGPYLFPGDVTAVLVEGCALLVGALLLLWASSR